MKTIKKLLATSVALSTLVLVGCFDKEPPMDCSAAKSKDAAMEILGGFKSEVQHLTNKVRCFAWEIKNISNFRQMSAFA